MCSPITCWWTTILSVVLFCFAKSCNFKFSGKLDYMASPIVNDIFYLLKFHLCLFFLHADPLLALKNRTPTIYFSFVEDKPFSNQLEVISICFTCLLLGGKWQSAINHKKLIWAESTVIFWVIIAPIYCNANICCT